MRTNREKFTSKVVTPTVILIFIILIVFIIDFAIDSFTDKDFIGGVWVEFHGFLIEALLILVLLTKWTDYQEKKRQQPVMTLIMSRLDGIELWLRSGFNHATKGESTSLNSVHFALYEINRHQQKMVFITDLNSSHIPTDVMSNLIEAQEIIEHLIEKTQFLILILTKQDKRCDYIMEAPFDEIKKLTAIFKELSLSYKYSRDQSHIPPDDNALLVQWNHYLTQAPLFSNPSEYRHNKRRNIYAFNVTTMTKIKTNAEVGDIAKTFKMH
jgi:hypothetical protein